MAHSGTRTTPTPPPRMDPGFTIGGWRDEDEFRLRRTAFGTTRLEQKRVFSDGTVQWRRPMMFTCVYFKGRNA
jgi:hypothetical protein